MGLCKLMTTCVILLMLAPAALAGVNTYSRIENMSGWGSCSACAGGATAIYWMRRGISSPSVDGNSAQFFIGGSKPFGMGLWWRRMATSTSASHFRLDLYQYLRAPSASQGIEYAANQIVNNRWYKFSTQCSFAQGRWRVWDSKNGGWVNTGAPCRRPAAYSWTHLVFEYARSKGKAVFLAITVNGHKYYLNKAFYPQAKSGSNGDIGIHYQLNGNRAMTDYSSWVDKMALTIW